MSRDEKLLNFQFRHQPKKNSRYAPLINYYNDGDYDLEASSRTEFIFKALEAFWLPFALEHQGASREEIEKAVARSTYALQSHIGYLQYRFNLKGPDLSAQTISTQTPAPPTTLTESSLSVVSNPSPARSLTPEIESIEPFAEEELWDYEGDEDEEDTILPPDNDDDVNSAFG